MITNLAFFCIAGENSIQCSENEKSTGTDIETSTIASNAVSDHLAKIASKIPLTDKLSKDLMIKSQNSPIPDTTVDSKG